MTVNEHEFIVCIDVDGTLVTPFEGKGLEITNPYSGSTFTYKRHYKNIELLKQYKGRGNFVRIWSAGGVKWAEAVIKALKLEKYVDSIETKPLKYVDDLDASQILGTRVFLEENE